MPNIIHRGFLQERVYGAVPVEQRCFKNHQSNLSALIIRFRRIGRLQRPLYQIVCVERRRQPHTGAYLEKLGFYDPLVRNNGCKVVMMNRERIEYWIGRGAQLTPQMAAFLDCQIPSRVNPLVGHAKLPIK